MTRDPYQGSVYDPASLHRYNYARANPANFIDPSGRLSAGEYASATWELTKKSFVLTAYSFVQNCTIYAIASSVQLVGDNAGFHVDELGTNFRACGATITVSNFGRAWAANFALMGLGYGLGAVAEWLEGAEEGTPVGRPSWRQSESDVGNDLGPGHSPQVSYKGGQPATPGTPGSVRPDWVADDGTASFEVKNYDINANSSGLINNAANQAIQRAANLPPGMVQNIIIDVRGQAVTAAQESSIIQAIVQKTGGIISPTSIIFKR